MSNIKEDNWIRRFSVSDPFKHNKGFTLYKITSLVYPKKYPEAITKIVIWKRYNDFKKLYKELKVRHKKLHLDDEFPAFVKAKFFSRFESDVVEERRQAALKLLEFVAQHPPLFTSDVFVKFFETGYTVDSEDGTVSNTAVGRSASPLPPLSTRPDPDTGQIAGPGSSDDDHTSFTTDTDSAISSPVQIAGPGSSDDDHTSFTTDTDSAISSPVQIAGPGSSDDDHTSFTTDTDSAISSPVQIAGPGSSDDDHTSFTTDTDSAISSPVQIAGPGSSDDDHTSFTTDTDSVISSPVQGQEPERCETPSVEEDTWSSRQLQPSQSQTTLSSLASVESLFSRQIQSFKNRFIGITSDTNDARQKEAEVSRYWTEAQKVVSTAEEKEREGDYQTAFNCYKAAIAQLLSGVQNDTDSDRRKLVKERTADYLCRAEFIANNFLSSDSNSVKKTESDIVPLSKLWQSLSDLQWFKVVGVVGKVMLVIDSRTNFLFIVKALYKSSYPINKNKCCIFPRRIPYMVELNSIFETDSSVFLVLQYISGGKLWDYVSPFFQKPQETPVKTRGSNPYSSLFCVEPEHISVSTSDSCHSTLNQPVAADGEVRSTFSSPGTSYLDLIRDYAENKRMEHQTVTEPTPPNLVIDKPSTVDEPQSTVYKIVSDTLSNNSCSSRDYTENKRMEHQTVTEPTPPNLVIDKPSTVDEPQSTVYKIVSDTLSNNSCSSRDNTLPTLTASSDNLYRDVLMLVNSEFTLNISDSVDIETKDLVEHAQRLLQSVDATLLESENVTSRVGLAVEPDTDLLSVASNHSGRSLDVCRLAPNINSKGSSPLSSVGPDAPPQWCQLEVSGAGIAEDTVRRWAAQLLVALQALHQMGIICLDLNPDNVLVCGNTVRLTYFCSFPGVEPQLSTQACSQLYTAPELATIFPPTAAADWWSLGTLLYQLLTGQSLSSYYPSGIFYHTVLHIPDTISVEARSLLKELLRHNPAERLGSGLLGVEEIKSHPFFDGIAWEQVYNDGLLPV